MALFLQRILFPEFVVSVVDCLPGAEGARSDIGPELPDIILRDQLSAEVDPIGVKPRSKFLCPPFKTGVWMFFEIPEDVYCCVIEKHLPISPVSFPDFYKHRLSFRALQDTAGQLDF
jgi:hypothetical protein